MKSIFINTNKIACLLVVLIGLFLICSCGTKTESHSETTNKSIGSQSEDSTKLKTEETAKIYTQAISDFIKAKKAYDNTLFDTLYFGKHIYGQPDDFPEIELPEKIENVVIKLVKPEVGHELQKQNKSLVYINMIGWIEAEKASFVLVVFSEQEKHQYDIFINYIFNSIDNKFDIATVELEDYKNLKTAKPKRISLYKDSRFISK